MYYIILDNTLLKTNGIEYGLYLHIIYASTCALSICLFDTSCIMRKPHSLETKPGDVKNAETGLIAIPLCSSKIRVVSSV